MALAGTAAASNACPQCVDPTLPAVYDDWHRALGAAVLAVHCALLVTAAALAWLQRRSRLLRMRNGSLLLLTYVGCAAAAHWPLREIVGEAVWPCLAYGIMSSVVALAFAAPIVVRLLRLASTHFAQDRVERALAAQYERVASGGFPGRTASAQALPTGGTAGSFLETSVVPDTPLADSPTPTTPRRMSLQPPPPASVTVPDAAPTALPAAPLSFVETYRRQTGAAFPLAPSRLGRALEWCVLDVCALHTALGEIIVLVVLEAPFVGFHLWRLYTLSRLGAAAVGCHPSNSEDAYSAALFAALGAILLAMVPGQLCRRDAYFHREELLALTFTLLLLSPFYIVPSITGHPLTSTSDAILPPARIVMCLTWVHLCMAYIVPSVASIIQDRRLRSVVPLPAPTLGDRLAHAAMVRTHSLLVMGTEPAAVAGDPANPFDDEDSQGRPTTAGAPSTMTSADVAARVGSSPTGGSGDDGGGGGGGGGGRRAGRGPAPVFTGLPVSAPTASHQQVGLLQFLVSCATNLAPDGASRDAAAPVTLREALNACVVAARKPAGDVTPMDRRLMAAVLAATAAGQSWLRPALRREMNTEVLLFLNDCYAFRSAATRASTAIMRIAPSPPPRLSAIATPPPLECIAEAGTSAAASEATANTHAGEASTSSAMYPLPGCPSLPSEAAARTAGATTRELTVPPAQSAPVPLPPLPVTPPTGPVDASPPPLVVPPPVSVAAHDVLGAILRRLVDVQVYLREIEFRYLQPFSPIKITLRPAVAADLQADMKAARATLSLLQSYVRVSFRAVPPAEMEAHLRILRHVLDAPAADALADLADGVLLHLLATPRAPRVLAATSTIAQTLLAARLRRDAAPPPPV